MLLKWVRHDSGRGETISQSFLWMKFDKLSLPKKMYKLRWHLIWKIKYKKVKYLNKIDKSTTENKFKNKF